MSALCGQYERQWLNGHIRTETAVLSTDEAIRNTAALNLLAFIERRVGIIANFQFRGTLLQAAIEGLNPARPELEPTGTVLIVAAEGNLWGPVG